MHQPASILIEKLSSDKDKLGLFCFSIVKLAPPVTTATNDSVLPAPGNGNHTFVSRGCYYDQLVMLIFCFCDPTYLPANPPFGYPLLLNYKSLSFPHPVPIS